MVRAVVLLAIVVGLSATSAFADSFRCPSSDALVEVGDTDVDVRAKCGSPLSVDVLRGRRQSVVERWIYDFGPAYFTRILFFKHGRLIEIDEGGYGRRP